MVRKKGTFPNYLRNTHHDDQLNENEREPQSSSFIAEDMHGATPSVPFLRDHKESFQRHQSQNPEIRVRKDYISEEKRRLRAERQEMQRQSASFYKSRRPFRASEVPSIWSAYSREEKREVDYQKIKEQLHVASDDLILLDLHPLKDTDYKRGPEKKTANKALHRSLSLIMEQEQVQPSWTHQRIIPRKPNAKDGEALIDDTEKG